MVRRQLGRLVLALGLIGTSLSLPSTAAAAGTESTAPARVTASDTRDVAALPCWVTPKAGTGATNIRRSPTTASERVGIIQEGQGADAVCNATYGGSYTACGGTSGWWVQVEWYGVWGYVALGCVVWYRD